jgi:hypothetical protein
MIGSPVARCLSWFAATLGLVLLLGCDASDDLDEVAAPPAEDAAAIQEWLRSGAYLEWERFDPPPTEGMAGGAQVYLSPSLVESLRGGAAVHPVGSAAVRELTAEGSDVPTGWALNHKLELGEGPDTWSFYEVFSTDADAEPLVFERAAPGCIGCHAEGVDFVRIEDF